MMMIAQKLRCCFLIALVLTGLGLAQDATTPQHSPSAPNAKENAEHHGSYPTSLA
jgi:hypothetical protein